MVSPSLGITVAADTKVLAHPWLRVVALRRAVGRPTMITIGLRRLSWRTALPRMTTDWALQALLAAAWRRKSETRVIIRADPGSQFSRAWQLFLSQHDFEACMSRRGNCHDNAVAESFFQLLKRERILGRTYLTRETARRNVFEYIEMVLQPEPQAHEQRNAVAL